MKVFLVITDLHISGQLKENRFSYEKELHVVFHKIIDLITSYKSRGYKVYLIFLGDIFDRSYKAPQKYGIDSSFFVKLHTICSGMFVTIGNHELNFYVNNPFWTLISNMKSERLSSLVKYNTQPLGYEDIFNVTDSIKVYNAVFHFNHFGCKDSETVQGKINFGFYHKPIYNTLMLRDARNKNISISFSDHITPLDIDCVLNYDFVFLGHMHWLYSVWKHQHTLIYGLGSLGRPSKSEVSDDFLERNIPAIIFENEAFVRIEDNFLKLPEREKSVISKVDIEQREKYEAVKVITEAKKYISFGDDPIKNIHMFLAQEDRFVSLFDKLLDGNWSDKEIIDKIFDIERRSLK